ncbi:MAG: histidine kinase, partial [Cyanobacteria bacterium P01_C01_bin.38]
MMGKNMVIEKPLASQKVAQMHECLWECVLQFARFSATQERHRIARDLHDSLGHALTGLNFQLQTAMQCQSDSSQANEFLNEAHRLVKLASQQVRQSVKTLRNDVLESQSLEQLIESLVSDFEQTTGILPDVEIDLLIAVSSQFIEAIYRI